MCILYKQLLEVYQDDEVGLRLLVAYQGADGLDALGDVGGGVAVVVGADQEHHDLGDRGGVGKSEIITSSSFRDTACLYSIRHCTWTYSLRTLGESPSSSPFCRRHRTFSVRSPPMPKLRLWRERHRVLNNGQSGDVPQGA